MADGIKSNSCEQ